MIYSFSEHQCENLKAKKRCNHVRYEKTKPTARTVGFCDKSSDSDKPEDEKLDALILTGMPNLYKQMRLPVSEQGYIKIPRSLIQSEGWRDLRMKKQKLFLYILQRVQFTPKKEKHNGIEFIVMPGQLCISYRSLLQDYNASVKYKDEKIDLCFLQRGVSLFLDNGWIDTQNDTGITIITITQPDLYDHFKNLNDTRMNTQMSTAAIQRKERKKEIEIKETNIDESVLSISKDSFLLHENSKKIIENDFIILQDYCKNKELNIREKTIRTWMKKYEGNYIATCLGLLLENIEKKDSRKKPIKNHEAWMEVALKRDYEKSKKNEKINCQFSWEFKNEKNWNELLINKKYCTDTKDGEQYHFILAHEIFKNILIHAEKKRWNRQ